MHLCGVGASAGGLEAMLTLFAGVRPQGNIAFVVAQHMAKNGHDELVVRLLARASVLPVVLGEDGMRLQPDTVHVLPSGKDGQVKGGVLALSAPAHLSTPSVNALFGSIAQSAGKNAIGIVLSGAGSDGALGCRAIREQGGLTLAQDPAQARFDGMPLAAIEAKVVDQTLSVERIGAHLAGLFPDTAAARTPALIPRASPGFPPVDSADAGAGRELETIVTLVREATGIDFSGYKEDTLLRRLGKRKSMLGVDSAAAYLALIHQQPEELHALQHAFLVSVSSFFRDRESFAALDKALGALIDDKPAGAPIRVWVPGCASGEEPYTQAILLKELSATHPIEVIATDLNAEALARCEAGVYRATAFKEMPAAYRDRYFTAQGQHFQISPAIKACVHFEQRDLFAEPPATELDLVSCRNVIIYLKSDRQDQLIQRLHRALSPRGLLFIGQAESLSGRGSALFSALDQHHRLYRRR